MTELHPPHKNLLSTARFSLNRASELLPNPETLSDGELAELESLVERSMSSLAEIGQAVRDEMERRES